MKEETEAAPLQTGREPLSCVLFLKIEDKAETTVWIVGDRDGAAMPEDSVFYNRES